MHGICIKMTSIMTSTLVALAKRVFEKCWYHHIHVKSNTNEALREGHKGCSEVAMFYL